jgi:hypothetical protein
MTRLPYVPNIPPGTPPGLAAELRKIQAAIEELVRVNQALEARVAALESP